MANSAKVIITSNLSRDPEMQYLENSGTALTKFSLPVDIGWGDKKDVEWVNVAVFGKEAERCREHLRKGSVVTVTGNLDKTWVNKEGKASLNVKAIQVDFISNFGSIKEDDEFEDMPF